MAASHEVAVNSTASLSESVSRPSGSKLLPSLGLILVTGGLLLISWFLYLWFKPLPPPYSYQLVDEGSAEKFANLSLASWPDLAIRKYQIRVPSLDKPVAVAYQTENRSGDSILLNWENLVSEPLVAMTVDFPELTSLAVDLTKHVPEEAVVLGWWDTSRQLNLLAGRDTLFTSYIGEPLIVPSYWKDRSNVIKDYEGQFWGRGRATDEERKNFEIFTTALSSEASKGVSLLRNLVGSREAYVIVHPVDLYKLALMHPDRIDLAFKDFPLTGNVHGLAGQVKAWMKENGYTTYTLQSISEKAVRAYFLNESKNGKILLAQMLPFMNSTPVDFEALEVVHKQGGYWVFRIPSH